MQDMRFAYDDSYFATLRLTDDGGSDVAIEPEAHQASPSAVARVRREQPSYLQQLATWGQNGGVAWGMKYYAPIAGRLPLAEQRALQIWHSPAYEDVATFLRTGGGPRGSERDYPSILNDPDLFKGYECAPADFNVLVQVLDQTLLRWRTPDNAVFFRGVNAGPWTAGFFKKAAEFEGRGEQLTVPSADSSFVSVTPSLVRAKSSPGFESDGYAGAVIEYHVPKGTPMAFLDVVIHTPAEEEFLLPRNLGWTVKKVTVPLNNALSDPGHIVVQVPSTDQIRFLN